MSVKYVAAVWQAVSALSTLITVDLFKNFLVEVHPSFVCEELGLREAWGFAQSHMCVGWEAWPRAQLCSHPTPSTGHPR